MTAFLSTPSARRATRSFSSLRSAQRDFYPRPPRGGRRSCCARSSRGGRFLSTPSARRATRSPAPDAPAAVFLSTPSARRATDSWCRTSQRGTISIHALREEGDRQPCRQSMRWNDFYPRPPRGGRLRGMFRLPFSSDFYPRPPRGGRRGSGRAFAVLPVFLSTPSARRATLPV